MGEYYQIIKGKVNQMRTFDTRTDMLHNRLAGLPSIGLAVLGQTAMAANQINLTDTEGLPGQHFHCLVGNIPVEGLFCRAFFQDGDEVEAVVEPQGDNSYFAYAVRRPIDHRLWLHPLATRGSIAALKMSVRYFHWMVLFILIVMGGFQFSLDYNQPFENHIVTLIALVFCALFVPTLISVLAYFSIDKNTKVANKIFATLGYPKPKSVDMSNEYLICLRMDPKAPDYFCDSKTPQFRQVKRGMMWVVHYREAPPIPDYITVIDGDKVNNTKHE